MIGYSICSLHSCPRGGQGKSEGLERRRSASDLEPGALEDQAAVACPNFTFLPPTSPGQQRV
jgi:hypothetical protein